MTELEDHIQKVKDTFHVNEVREHQKDVLSAIYGGKDVFFMAPTGSGKSLTYEMFPLLTDLRTGRCDSMVIVVSPLTALINSQIEKLKSYGLVAIHLTSETESIPQDCKYVFSSPEMLLTHCRHQLLSPRVHNSVVGFFIDEGHCIVKWGKNDTKTKKAFREHFSRLGEVRSLLPASVPVVVMTATATAAARRDIIKLAGIRDYHEVILSPNRSNVRYAVTRLPTLDLYAGFKHIIDDIEINSTMAERVIIYCRKKEQCCDLYELFSSTLREKGYSNGVVGDDRTRMFAMFHSKTQEEVKQSVLDSFTEENGHIRVVFCTVAFGMGIDVKGTYCVVHLGPANTIEDYLQESGRAGRDGRTLSHAVLITYPHCTSGNVSEEMKTYCKDKMCKRKMLLEPFGFSDVTAIQHSCCDSCTSLCECLECQKDIYKFTSNIERNIKSTMSLGDSESNVHYFSPMQKLELQSKLLGYRISLGSENTLFHGVDLNTGFTRQLIDDIVKNAEQVTGPELLQNKFNFLCKEHVVATWNIICDVLESDFLSDFDTDSLSDSSDSDMEMITKNFRTKPLVFSSDSE